MKILVQKFGGTSVATQQRREMVAQKVIDAVNRGFSPVVVVSAIGRKGDPYATDTLLSLISNGKSYLNNRETDLLLCCGEIISAVVMAETMQKRGYKVKVLTGGQAGIVTDANYTDAEILRVDKKNILGILSEGIIPIVTGFQGSTENGDFTTIGRGGSDVTSAVLGEALQAQAVEIYTDVDGIMTADPKIVPDAKVLDRVSYNEVFHLSDQGAKVIHPKAVEYAMRGNVPLLIKNTMTDSPGTIISSSSNSPCKVISGITHMSNRTQISVTYNEVNDMYNNNIFEILAENKISIDLINVFPNYKVFTVDAKDTDKTENILKDLGLGFNTIRNCSKIAVIGSGMRGIPGVMSKILKALNQSDVKVLQTADSHTTIWCLVREEDTIKAINALHRCFGL